MIVSYIPSGVTVPTTTYTKAEVTSGVLVIVLTKNEEDNINTMAEVQNKIIEEMVEKRLLALLYQPMA
jgi:hypothetical protein